MKTSLITSAIALVAIIVALSSCGHALSGATGQPILVTPVERIGGGTPINVATVDLIRAESQPDNVYGLYNAGAVADFAGRIVDSGK